MKIMISQPMNGLTEEEIRKHREYWVDVLESQGHIVVDSIFTDVPKSKNIPLHYLADSLRLMADVDAVLFVGKWCSARGCILEHACCSLYGVEILYETHFEKEV